MAANIKRLADFVGSNVISGFEQSRFRQAVLLRRGHLRPTQTEGDYRPSAHRSTSFTTLDQRFDQHQRPKRLRKRAFQWFVAACGVSRPLRQDCKSNIAIDHVPRLSNQASPNRVPNLFGVRYGYRRATDWHAKANPRPNRGTVASEPKTNQGYQMPAEVR
jgi:hypothetical protein